MLDSHSNDKAINISQVFTDLFHLIKKCKSTDDNIGLDYTNDEINLMIRHADNAITSILHGLQAMGNLIASASLSDKDDIAHIGYFLTLISNLMEALTILRADCDLQLDKGYDEFVDKKGIIAS